MSTPADVDEALAVNVEEWREELPLIEEWFEFVGEKLPTGVKDEFEALKQRLAEADLGVRPRCLPASIRAVGVPSADAPAPGAHRRSRAGGVGGSSRSAWSSPSTLGSVARLFLGRQFGPRVGGRTNVDASDETVVLVEVTAIHPTDNRVDVDVRVIPQKSFMDPDVRHSQHRHGGAALPVHRVRRARPCRRARSQGGARHRCWPPATPTGGRSTRTRPRRRRGRPGRLREARDGTCRRGWRWPDRCTAGTFAATVPVPLCHAGQPDDNVTITFSRARGPMD